MMYFVLIFWLVLILPGYAVLRRWFRDDLECGLLGVIGLSYLATFALLSPVVIIGYLFEVPLWVFSGAIVAAVAWGAYDVSRAGGWNDLWKLLRGGLCIELAVVLAIVVLDVFVGSFFGGDSMVHLARIRFLVDHGLSNQDPFVTDPAFYPIYHTNLLHALYASASQLTLTDHLGAWHMSLAWSKLLCACGGYLLGWYVFRRPWAAWAAALFLLMHRGPVPFTVYPNQVAPFFIMPILIGFAVQAVTDGADRRTWIRFAATSLLLGQVHGLYVLFALLAVGPVIGAAAAHRWLKQRDDRTWLLTAAAALLIGLPFPAISKLTTRPTSYDAAALRGFDEERAQFVTAEVVLLGTLRMRNPDQGFMKGWWRPLALIAGCVIGLMTARRRAVWAVVGVAAIAGGSLYLPPLATFLLETLGREWILVRFEVFLVLCTAAVLPAAISFLAEMKTGHWALRVLLAGAALFCGEMIAGRSTQNDPTFSWSNHYEDAFQRRMADLGPNDPVSPRISLRMWRRYREFYLEHLEPGATVLANVPNSMIAVALTDVTIVYSASSSLGVKDQLQRRADYEALVHPQTNWALRSELLRRYRIEYSITIGNPSPDWAMNIATGTVSSPELDIYITRIELP